MKRVEVGRFRVLLDDRGEGAVVIDHVDEKTKQYVSPFPGRLLLEPGEFEDLLVALDGVQEHLIPKPLDKRTKLEQIEDVLRGIGHKLYAIGVRMRFEIHVEDYELRRLAHEAGREVEKDVRRPHDTAKLPLAFGALVAQRGRRV